MHHPQWNRIGVCGIVEPAMHSNHSLKIRKLMIALATGLYLSGLSVTPSVMAVELDFNISAPTSGTISYGGLGGALTGTSIEVDNVVGLSTPLNSNVTSTCVNCVLNFTSGTLSGSGGGSNNWWRFGSGGTITITGGVTFQSGPDIPSSPPSALLSGTFDSAFVQDLGVQGFKVTFGTFSDTKHPVLLNYYGLDPSAQFQGALSLLFAAPDGGIGSAFSSTSVFSGNVVNTIAAVPVPGAALLFASGLSAMACFRRRLA